MISITAKLIGGSVNIPGENIILSITFLNTADTGDTNNVETLAWASVQIHCLCTTNPKLSYISKLAQPSEVSQTATTISDTSFIPYKADTAQGQIVLSTKPKILFCDLQLLPGLNKSFVYTESLPAEAPPTYRGKLVKYSYKITVGAQRVNSPIKLLRIPLRVLAISGLPDYNLGEDSEDLSPSNPFLDAQSKEHELSPALQLVQNITARRSPNFYNITNTRGKVGRFCLFKQAYRLGEDIVGTFDFSQCTVPCIQLTVTLQCEEHLADDYANVNNKGEIAVISFSKHHEICLHLTHCWLNLPIPMHATPAFHTELMQLKWKLHFEFVTGHPPLSSSSSSSSSSPSPNAAVENLTINNDGYWQAPEYLHIETMIWDLPVQIYPALPTPEPYSKNKYSLII